MARVMLFKDARGVHLVNVIGNELVSGIEDKSIEAILHQILTQINAEDLDTAVKINICWSDDVSVSSADIRID